MLYHLKSTLKSEDIKAIIFGEFIKSDEHINFTINDFANQNSEIPMYKTNKIGHGKNNFPIIYNEKGLIRYTIGIPSYF